MVASAIVQPESDSECCDAREGAESPSSRSPTSCRGPDRELTRGVSRGTWAAKASRAWLFHDTGLWIFATTGFATSPSAMSVVTAVLPTVTRAPLPQPPVWRAPLESSTIDRTCCDWSPS